MPPPPDQHLQIGLPNRSAIPSDYGAAERTGDVRRALTETVGLEPPFHSSLLISPRLAGARSDVSRLYRSHYVRMGVSDSLAVFTAMVLARLLAKAAVDATVIVVAFLFGTGYWMCACFVWKGTIRIQTAYASDADPNQTSCYGRGTTDA